MADVVARFAAPSPEEEAKGAEPAGVFLEKYKVRQPKLIGDQCKTKRTPLLTSVKTDYQGKFVDSVNEEF